MLAAGEGRRFGMPKALATLAGTTLVERVAATCALSLADAVVVVAGARSAEVAARVREVAALSPDVPVTTVEHEGWRAGRTGSLQAGWRSLPEGAHVLVFPVDHPCVRLVTLDALLGVFGYAAAAPEIVVPVQSVDGSRRRGHPILLSASLRDEVMALGPDAPLHDVVHAHVVLEVPVDDDGILLDVDSVEDLGRAEALLQDRSPAY